jgi:DNA polymerase-3 subunit alpha
LVNNQFIYFKLSVKEGWVNRDTGKKSEARIQFLEAKQLQDVLASFAKKLIITMNIKELQSEMITKLSRIFQANSGDNNVTFEVMEVEKVTKEIAPAVVEAVAPEATSDEENLEEEMELAVPTVVEETKVITYLSMPSRKLKVNISGELLRELESLDLKFKLN